MKQKKYTMSRAALEARKKGARNAAKKRKPGKQWYSVSLGVDTVAAIDAARGDLSRDAFVARLISRHARGRGRAPTASNASTA